MAVTDFELGQARQFAQSNSITGNLSFLEGNFTFRFVLMLKLSFQNLSLVPCGAINKPQVLFATVAANLKFVSSNLFLKQMLSCIILVSAWLDRAENKVCKRVGTGNFLELNFVLASFLTALFVIKTFCDRFL